MIAFLMDNKLAFPIIWLACLSINVVPAFINTSLTGPGLAHCESLTPLNIAYLVKAEADEAIALSRYPRCRCQIMLIRRGSRFSC